MNHVTQLSDAMVAALRARYAEGDIVLGDIAAGMGMSRWGLNCLLTGRTRRDAGGPIHPRVRDRTAMQRFCASVSLPDKEDGCWMWKKSIAPSGYGKFWLAPRSILAHRFSYENFVGPIEAGLEIDHLCRNTTCVNPKHLEAVTPQTNVLRGVGPAAANSKKTHCVRGHEFKGGNLRYDALGRRVCRKCMAYLGRRWREKNRGAVVAGA